MDIISKNIRYLLTLYLGFISVLFLILFGILNLNTGNKISGIIEICFGLVLLIFLFLLIKSKQFDSLSHFILFLALSFFTFELFNGGYKNTAIYWFYFYPIFCYSLKSRKQGKYFNLAFIIIIVAAYFLSKTGVFSIPYREADYVVFAISFIGHSIFLYMLALIREITSSKEKEELFEIKKLNKQLEYLCSYDTLTGIFNRRQIIQILEKEISRFERFNELFTILLLDVDYFKKVNDKYGHLFGDKVLIEITHLIQKKILRSIDSIGRYGGEEFLIILPETDKFGAVIASERVRNTINEFKFYNAEIKKDIKVTVSIGVSSIEKGEDINAVLRKADIALYKAKHNGRDRVEVYIEKIEGEI